MLHAFYYSLEGLKTGWRETAFRQEAMAAMVMVPLAFWLGRSWVETAVLVGVVMLVMIVELLNTAVERTIDRIGPEWHEYSKHAKDFGSAAVLLSLLLAAGVWLGALYHYFVS
jgi:diacylglycerol kinase (ATP)